MNEELLKTDDIKKIEIPQQAGVNEAQSSVSTAWANLAQLLDKISKVLNDLTLDTVLSDAICAHTPDLGKMVIKQQATWKEIFENARKHHLECIEILEKDMQAMRLQKDVLGQMLKLPNDSELIQRLNNLQSLLDGLEKHRASGLIEAISKL